MGEPSGRERRRIEDLPPEVRARADDKLAEWHSAEHRAREMAAREAIARDGGVATPGGFRPVKVPDAAAIEFGRRLRALREERGLSIEDVVRASGIDRGAVSHLEGGEDANPTVGTLERYARALGGRIRLEFEPTD